MRKRRYKVKNKGKAITGIAIIVVGLMLIVGLVFGIIPLVKGGKKGAKSGSAELPFDASSNYTYTGAGFLYFGDGKLHYDDIADNSKDTSYRINTEELKLAASRGVSVLYHDTALQIVGGGDSLVFSGRVLGVRCGNEHVAVLREDSAGGTAIVIYDKAGIQVDQMDFDATDLIGFGFSNTSDETLWTLEADYSTPTPVSTLTTYNLATKRTTGVMTVQGQLVEDVLFTNSSIFLSATSSLIRCNLAGSAEAYRMTVYGWELLDYSLTDSGPVLMYGQRGAEAHSTIKLYTMAEGDVGTAEIASVHPPTGYVGAFLMKGRLCVYTPTELYTYSAKGELISREGLNETITAAEKLSDDHALLHKGDTLLISAK
ncbi:MAG: hypothetical protein IJC24_03615 [Clostridia bacterium]|nr:hypothetical protein [Clostridia bacterium]